MNEADILVVYGGGYSVDYPNADYWKKFYKEKDLYLPKGKYTVRVGGAYYLRVNIFRIMAKNQHLSITKIIHMMGDNYEIQCKKISNFLLAFFDYFSFIIL